MVSEGPHADERSLFFDAGVILKEHFPHYPQDALKLALDYIEEVGGEGWLPNDLESEDGAPPAIPDDAPGVSFSVVEDGRIGLRYSGTTTAPEEDETGSLRNALQQDVAELLRQLAGSNAHAFLTDFLRRYQRTLLHIPLSIDLLYAHGNTLMAAHRRLTAQVAQGDLPELPPAAAALLDSVVAVHGVVISSTERGQCLLDRAHRFESNERDLEQLSQSSLAFSEAVASATDLATEEAQDTVRVTNEAFANAPRDARTAEIAQTTNRNFLAATVRTAASENGRGLFSAALQQSVPGTLIVTAGSDLANVAYHFLLHNWPLLQELVALSGSQMSWLPAMMNWLQRRMNW